MPRFTSGAGRETVLTLRKKRKSLAEVVNEQVESALTGGRPSHRGGADDEYDDNDDGVLHGAVEEYDLNDADEALAADRRRGGSTGTSSGSRPTKASSTTGGSEKGVSRKRLRSGAGSANDDDNNDEKGDRRLRRRGPLDQSLSEGRYAATPVNVEAAMDDIFGALDMGDMDAEGEEVLYDANDDDEEPAMSDGGNDDDDLEEAGDASQKAKTKTKKKARRAKDLSEEEYIAWLEEKSRARRRRAAPPLSATTDGAGGSGSGALFDPVLNGDEDVILHQLEGLRQTHMTLVAPASSTTDGAASSASAEADVDAGARSRERTQDAVKHYILLYSQLLRIRVKLQPLVTKAVTLPQYYARPLFVGGAGVEKEEEDQEEEGEAVDHAAIAEKYQELCRDLAETLATLYACHTGGENRSPSPNADAPPPPPPTFRQINSYHQHILKGANACLEHWGSKLVQANSAKLHTIAQPLPQQIAAILAVKSRLLSKVRKNRSKLPILAHPLFESAASSQEAKAKLALHLAEGAVDEEIFDDADFLRELVRRGGTVANRLEQQLNTMNKELLPEKESARKGFHRLTKGKSVNYEPRPKIVGFVVADTYENSGRNDVLLQSLFQ